MQYVYKGKCSKAWECNKKVLIETPMEGICDYVYSRKVTTTSVVHFKVNDFKGASFILGVELQTKHCFNIAIKQILWIIYL